MVIVISLVVCLLREPETTKRREGNLGLPEVNGQTDICVMFSLCRCKSYEDPLGSSGHANICPRVVIAQGLANTDSEWIQMLTVICAFVIVREGNCRLLFPCKKQATRFLKCS